jgi:hypothetical protein
MAASWERLWAEAGEAARALATFALTPALAHLVRVRKPDREGDTRAEYGLSRRAHQPRHCPCFACSRDERMGPHASLKVGRHRESGSEQGLRLYH